MKRISLVVLLASVFPTGAFAQSRFDGTWRIQPNSGQFSGKPDVYLLRDGVYRCSTCDPPLEVKADGKDHKVTGDPCYNAVAVEVVDALTVEETHKEDGKTVETARMTLAPDGSTLTAEWMTRCNAKSEPIWDAVVMKRVAAGPAGAHAISGAWQKSKKLNFSENALTGKLKLEGDTFSFSDPVGQGYTAKLDGTETPTKGELGNGTVSVRRLREDTVEETHKLDGKVVEIVRYVVAADGKTINLTIENKVKGTTSQYLLIKQ